MEHGHTPPAPPDDDRILNLRRPLFWTCLGIGLAYGLFARFLFGLHQFGRIFEIMSLSFIFGVPLVVGFLTVYVWPGRDTASPWTWATMPWGAALLTIGAAVALSWEGLICAIVWVPAFLTMASVGGVLGGLLDRVTRHPAARSLLLSAMVLLPFGLSPLEQRTTSSPAYRTAETHIDIAADADVIWKHIREVATIADDEQGFSLAHAVGFPRPVAATLTGAGVGAVRHATFEGGVLFVETITAWEPERLLSFSIEPDPGIPPTTFDRHVVVGGRYFDVLSGTYRIERVGPGRHILHLSSRHRLSTRFDRYTRLWTDFFMNDIQRHILTVVKRRCEPPTP